MTTGKGPANSPDALTAMPCRESPAPGPAAHERALRTLSPAECYGLLEAGGIGRVGFAAADGIMMLPVNFAVAGKAVIFRTAPDTLLAVYANGRVSFEADHLDQAHRAGWSVLLHGHAHTVTDEREVKRLEDRTRLEPWAAPATCMCASRRPGSAGDASSRAGPAPWRQTPEPRPSAPSQVRQAEPTDDITPSDGEDRGQRAHPRRSERRRESRSLSAEACRTAVI